MSTKACPQCKSANLASAVLCVNCGARLGVPEQPSAWTDAPPPSAPQPPPAEWGRPLGTQPGDASPTPPMPAGATVQYWGAPPGYAPAPPRRRSFLVPVLALIAAAVIVFGVLSVMGGGDSLPDEIDGLGRLETADAVSFERGVSDAEVGEANAEGAMYGDGTEPSLLVELITNLPTTDLEGATEFVFEQSANAFAGASGGTVDTASAVSTSVGSVEYRCGELTVSGSQLGGFGPGAFCVWVADDLGLVITFRTTDPTSALEEARTAYEAIHA